MAIFKMGAVFRRATLVALVVTLAACSTTGQTFNTQALADFVPGKTTYAEAVKMLGAEPANTYSQLNGTMVARWAHKASVLTDAIYFRQEVMLRFGPDGRFESMVDSVNVLSRPGVPNSPATGSLINEPTQPAPIAPVAAPRQPLQPTSKVVQPLHTETVTYPVGAAK